MLSGLNHFAFCRRNWALVHVEQQWAENVHTAEGDLFHRRTHDETQTEMRGDTLIVRGLRVQSRHLSVSGICDVVEFHRVSDGITLAGREGQFSVYPVEYKKGSPQLYEGIDPDQLQLCAQAMCLEEMLACEIPEGSLFYGETRRRVRVALTTALRAQVEAMIAEMHQYFSRGYTPQVKPGKRCSGCSLNEICLPRLRRSSTVKAYINDHLHGEEEP